MNSFIKVKRGKELILDFLSNTRKCLYRKNRRLWTITIVFPIRPNLMLFLTRIHSRCTTPVSASTHQSFIRPSIFSGSYIKCIAHHNIRYIILKAIHILSTFRAKIALVTLFPFIVSSGGNSFLLRGTALITTTYLQPQKEGRGYPYPYETGNSSSMQITNQTSKYRHKQKYCELDHVLLDRCYCYGDISV